MTVPKTKVTVYVAGMPPYEYLTDCLPGDGITSPGVIFTSVEGRKVFLSSGLPFKMETIKQEN
jgi:hypothetical protein